MDKELTSEAVQGMSNVLLREDLSLAKAEIFFDLYSKFIKANHSNLESAPQFVQKYTERLELAGIEGHPEWHHLPGIAAKFTTEISNQAKEEFGDAEPEFEYKIAETWIKCMELFPSKEAHIRYGVARYLETNSNNYFLRIAAGSFTP